MGHVDVDRGGLEKSPDDPRDVLLRDGRHRGVGVSPWRGVVSESWSVFNVGPVGT